MATLIEPKTLHLMSDIGFCDSNCLQFLSFTLQLVTYVYIYMYSISLEIFTHCGDDDYDDAKVDDGISLASSKECQRLNS